MWKIIGMYVCIYDIFKIPSEAIGKERERERK